jgi:Galactose oxidase, central domain
VTRFDELDQALSTWFDGETVAPAPAGLLERVTAGTSRRRPRPPILATVHDAGLPRVGVGLPSVGPIGQPRMILVLGLLALALAAGAAVVGSRLLPSISPIQGVFERVDPMPIDARDAVVLPDGRVLVVGPDESLGDGQTFILGFDPDSRSFAPIGERAGSLESVTALQDGRVLIVGFPQGPTGRADGYETTGAIFDPTTGTTTELGATVVPRVGHGAALLADGRVLLVGGEPDGATDSAEIFDPATGRFTATGSLARPRGLGTTATLLGDGRVLVAGGADQAPDDLSELFDPATGTFAVTGRMSAPRTDFTATLLRDGRVLFAGGYSGEDASGGARLATVGDVYDPTTGMFSPTEAMQLPRYRHLASILRDGRVLIAGGIDAPPSSARTRAAEIFDPSTGRFESTGSLTAARGNTSSAVLPDGDVLVFGDADFAGGGLAGGGADPSTNARSAEVFR